MSGQPLKDTPEALSCAVNVTDANLESKRLTRMSRLQQIGNPMKKAAISVIGYDRLGIIATITSISSVGVDIVALPGNMSADTIAAIIADEMAIGVINRKTTILVVSIIPTADPRPELGPLCGSNYQ